MSKLNSFIINIIVSGLEKDICDTWEKMCCHDIINVHLILFSKMFISTMHKKNFIYIFNL